MKRYKFRNVNNKNINFPLSQISNDTGIQYSLDNYVEKEIKNSVNKPLDLERKRFLPRNNLTFDIKFLNRNPNINQTFVDEYAVSTQATGLLSLFNLEEVQSNSQNFDNSYFIFEFFDSEKYNVNTILSINSLRTSSPFALPRFFNNFSFENNFNVQTNKFDSTKAFLLFNTREDYNGHEGVYLTNEFLKNKNFPITVYLRISLFNAKRGTRHYFQYNYNNFSDLEDLRNDNNITKYFIPIEIFNDFTYKFKNLVNNINIYEVGNVVLEKEKTNDRSPNTSTPFDEISKTVLNTGEVKDLENNNN